MFPRVNATNPGNTLYVTGLSSRVTEKDLEMHFSKEGKVVECYLIVEPRTRASRGFAFVTMNNVEDVERCIIYLNNSVMEGRYISVEKASAPVIFSAGSDPLAQIQLKPSPSRSNLLVLSRGRIDAERGRTDADDRRCRASIRKGVLALASILLCSWCCALALKFASLSEQWGSDNETARVTGLEKKKSEVLFCGDLIEEVFIELWYDLDIY
ncbi:hypothetical protein ZIOFF_040004 [Zingiber officinale]|uniref:RRM domain-containing protein n=1 Tax=Zingiber officinale TaxID=94328 RepID=A0A8J5G272_ZINOF|nr:hypothetical protein ZIOFF_040004 [Zingiber officinale]